MKILVVEDKIVNLANAVEYLRHLGHKVFYSVDLSGALKILQTEKLDGVITDVTFQENGVNEQGNYIYPEKINVWAGDVRMNFKPPKDLHEYFLEKLSLSNPKKEIIGDAQKARDQEYFLGETSDKLREDVTNASMKFCSAPYWNGRGSFIQMDVPGQNSVRMEYSKPFYLNPALGYFVIKECMTKSIPVAFCTATGHAVHSIPAVLATGIITTEEYENTLRNDGVGNDFCDRITVTSGGVFTPGEKTKECWEKAFEVLMIRM